MSLPTELEFFDADDNPYRVRFDYDRGEQQWFDARAGVGSPGYDPSVDVTEINFGDGWKTPDEVPGFDFAKCEEEVMDRLIELEDSERAEYDERERDK